ncbi:MAG: HK97 family phage prohead protease [Waterburya sp.]
MTTEDHWIKSCLKKFVERIQDHTEIIDLTYGVPEAKTEHSILIEGYTVLWNMEDLDCDIFLPNSLQSVKVNGKPLPIRMQYVHDDSQAIGELLSMKTDDKGLYITAIIHHPTCIDLITSFRINGLSIGFRCASATYRNGKDKRAGRIISAAWLAEISIVPFPAQTLCRFAWKVLETAPKPTELMYCINDR